MNKDKYEKDYKIIMELREASERNGLGRLLHQTPSTSVVSAYVNYG